MNDIDGNNGIVTAVCISAPIDAGVSGGSGVVCNGHGVCPRCPAVRGSGAGLGGPRLRLGPAGRLLRRQRTIVRTAAIEKNIFIVL